MKYAKMKFYSQIIQNFAGKTYKNEIPQPKYPKIFLRSFAVFHFKHPEHPHAH
jgi:hypothetical protein